MRVNSLDRELLRLIVSIEASSDQLNLLLAVCDDRLVQNNLIQQYESKLSDRGIAAHQTYLKSIETADARSRQTQQQHSLKATLAALVDQEPSLRSSILSVVTVLGASDLSTEHLPGEKSEREKFFFSLQWTRESLRNFRFPVVVWLSSDLENELAQQASDFWSWRGGVFYFGVDQQD